MEINSMYFEVSNDSNIICLIIICNKMHVSDICEPTSVESGLALFMFEDK